ncbi:exonuclease [Roseibacterium sp. SDUM158016]|uniref:exonuclease n=1 Tax=Roseicyclus sediminis TaxID=2980997 RepID=UPI0021D168D1|nr:exonuclease [Roseibacterium sp. SDUM158016]MCU4652157.1 exonuclease [Roseibacterium sp. SDUM158016]
MAEAVIFDCEHLVQAGSPQRFWCGPDDPDPLLVQIGAVRLSLEPPYGIGATFDCIVRPVGRHGPVAIPEFFTKLTGISEARVAAEGVDLAEALDRFAAFAGDAPVLSWGKDEITSLAPSCFAAGILCPIPPARFANAAALVHAAGEPMEVVHTLRSHTIAAHFGLPPEARAHDGLDDARSVARVLSHLMREGRLPRAAFGGAETA